MSEEEKASILELVLKYQETRNSKTLDEIVKYLLPTVKKLARKLARRYDHFDDLVQVASIGMLKAIDNYEYNNNTNFYGYLIPVMIGEIKHFYRDQSWTINASRNKKELSTKIYQLLPELIQKLRRTPTVKDIAEELNISQDEVIEAMNYQSTYQITSLDEKIPLNNGDKRINIRDVLGELDSNLEKIDDKSLLKDILSYLNKLEKRLLILRYVERLTQQEIADILGISQMQVSRLIKALGIKLEHIKNLSEI
jgi:RNA polymerase sigma-B factor